MWKQKHRKVKWFVQEHSNNWNHGISIERKPYASLEQDQPVFAYISWPYSLLSQWEWKGEAVIIMAQQAWVAAVPGKWWHMVTQHLRKVKVKSLSRVPLFATPRTVAYRAPSSMGFARQEYWSGVPFTERDRKWWYKWLYHVLARCQTLASQAFSLILTALLRSRQNS